MWTGSPKTLKEYLQRRVLAPWLFAGAMVVIMGIIVLITVVGGRDVLHGFKPASSTDKTITVSVAGVALLAALVYGVVGSQKAKILLMRGRRAPGRVHSSGSISKHGQTPVTVEYVVAGRTFRLKRDMPVSEVAELQRRVHVIYDPQSPGRAFILSPKMAALPE